MKTKLQYCLLAATLSTGLCALPALADTVSLTLTNSTISTSAGTTVAYYGTFFAPGTNGATIYLNGDSGNVSSPLTFDDTPIFNDEPQGLTPGQTITEELFTVAAAAGTASGSYMGSFTIQGGAIANNSDDDLASVNFTTAIAPAATVTPEPSTWLLLGTGALGIGIMLRRRNSLPSAAPLA